MAASGNRKKKSSFFLMMGIIGLLAVLAGFAKTFIGPSLSGTFNAPMLVYFHGAFAFSWILLFLLQTILAYVRNYRLHMSLGFLALFIGAGVAITMLPAGVYQVQREIKEGLGDMAISGIVGTCTSSVMFLSLVIAGLIYRKNPQAHKRLMLLATIIVLWPAWFRFRHYFPSVARPEIWFAVVLADSFIVIAWIWDKWYNGRVHPVLGYIGALIIGEHIFEVLMFDNTTWRAVAKTMYTFLSGF